MGELCCSGLWGVGQIRQCPWPKYIHCYYNPFFSFKFFRIAPMISTLLQGIFKVSSNKHVAMLLLSIFRPVDSRHSGDHAIPLSFVVSKFFGNTVFYSRLLVIAFLSKYPIRLGHLMPIICNIGLLNSHQLLSQKTQSPMIRSNSSASQTNPYTCLL